MFLQVLDKIVTPRPDMGQTATFLGLVDETSQPELPVGVFDVEYAAGPVYACSY